MVKIVLTVEVFFAADEAAAPAVVNRLLEVCVVVRAGFIHRTFSTSWFCPLIRNLVVNNPMLGTSSQNIGELPGPTGLTLFHTLL